MNSIVKELKEQAAQAVTAKQWKLEELCKMAAIEIEVKIKFIATLEAENARLTATIESMSEDAVQNTYAFGLMLKSNKEQAAEIEQLKEKVRYAYAQIEALEAK